MKKIVSLLIAFLLVVSASLAGFNSVSAAQSVVSTEAELRAALADANIDTFKLGADITVSVTNNANDILNFNRVITLNLAGFTLSSNNSDYGTIYVSKTGEITINDSVGSGKVVNTGGAYALSGYGKATVNAGTFESNYAAIYVNNSFEYETPATYGDFTINGGTFISDWGMLNCGVLTINEDISVESTTCAINNSGELNINATPALDSGYAIIAYSGNDAPDVPNTGTVNVASEGELVIPDGSAAYVAGTINNDGIIENNGTLELDTTTGEATIINNNIINNLGTVDTSLVAAEDVPIVNASTGIINNSQAVPSDWTETHVDNTANGKINAAADLFNMNISASVTPSYTVVIPQTVSFGSLNRSMVGTVSRNISVGISNAVLESDASLTVTAQSNFKMHDKSGTGNAHLNFNLYNVTPENIGGATPIDYDGVFSVFESSDFNAENSYSKTVTGCVTTVPSNLSRAGEYSGTIVFVCSYD